MNGIPEAQMLESAPSASRTIGTEKKSRKTPANFKDISGMRFGRVSVIRRHGTSNGYSATWECACSCGTVFVAKGNLLRRGGVRSCGCLREEILKQLFKTHGKSKTNIYMLWASIKRRCLNKRQRTYSNYGARGISICDEWKNSFEEFYSWAIKNGYSENLTIDRINNNDGYTPTNCRFVTPKVNSNNTRKSRIWIINGEKFISASDAAMRYGVCVRTIRNWCLGDKQKGTSPKQKCSANKKY